MSENKSGRRIEFDEKAYSKFFIDPETNAQFSESSHYFCGLESARWQFNQNSAVIESLAAEIEYLNRMLADERSGECDKKLFKEKMALESELANLKAELSAEKAKLPTFIKLDETLGVKE